MFSKLKRKILQTLFKATRNRGRKIQRFVIIIGAMKCGTTSLFNYLLQHSEIAFPLERKELSFFSDDRNWQNGLDWYYHQWRFNPDTHRYALEASTYYTKFSTARFVPERMAQVDAGFKLIYSLRHPIDRIESHIAHEIASGRYNAQTKRAITEDAVNTSRYAMQLDRYYHAMPSVDILLFDFERFKKDPIAELRSCDAFLGLPPDFRYKRIRPQNVRRKKHGSNKFKLSAAERRRFAKMLQADVKRLKSHYHFDTQNWQDLDA